jgi:hypothetical protein
MEAAAVVLAEQLEAKLAVAVAVDILEMAATEGLELTAVPQLPDLAAVAAVALSMVAVAELAY